MIMPIQPRTGQAAEPLDRTQFEQRFRENFYDPAFRAEDAAIDRLAAIAWDAYTGSRKAPLTEKAGAGYADPDYDLSTEWLAARRAIDAAQRQQADPGSVSRVLVVIGSARNDGTCPGEMSKSWRMAQLVCDELERVGIAQDLLDLSVLTSEYGLRIYPCKACVSTAMPLCHWPCSCYPNHALAQTGDWMNALYPRWVAAHGVIIITPVYWYQSPSPLKLMIDRLVCADGGNPDPTSTGGKDAIRAKQVELDGWSYPKHLDGRVYGVVVHGDVAGIEDSRRALTDWLDWMGLYDAGVQARLDRYVGYYKPYATSHGEFDVDLALQQEVKNVAIAVAGRIGELRAGRFAVDFSPPRPRPK
jgi:multimeric flavodoxin WrbA